MKTKKKNRFLTFCFSCLPGAGEMYMGFMRMGVSLMILFLLAIIIPISLRLDALSVSAMVVWFYGFFHANHLASLSDEEFDKVKDEYLLGLDTLTGGKDFISKYQKWVAAVLIMTGVLLLWNTATDMAYRFLPDFIYEAMRIVGNYAPRILVAVVIIFIGIKMISGRKEQLAFLGTQQASEGEKEAAQEARNVAGKGSGEEKKEDLTGREE